MRRHRGVGLVIVGVAIAGCASEEAIAPLSAPPTTSAPSDARTPDASRPGPSPGATHGAGGLLPLTPPDVSVDAATEDFHEQIRIVLRVAQARAHRLQESAPLEVSSRYALGPDQFPSPTWGEFFDDQAALVREAAGRLREIAPSAPDPEAFAALIDPWESEVAGRFEDFADAARRSDEGRQYTKVVNARPLRVTVSTVVPNSDSLWHYLIALPGYGGPYAVLLWPDTGE